jgi:signal transduction histidine kinase
VASAYAEASRLAWWLSLVAAACAGVAVAAGWLLSRYLTRPLPRLAQAAQRIGAGDFGARVSVDGRDEVATVAVAFNQMATGLEGSYRALEQKTREAEAARESLARLNAELNERVRQRTQQLEAANSELEAFSYTVSHDLKTPLRAMEGFARALREDCADRLDAAGLRYLEVVQGSAVRMGALIDDLLRYSRLERRAMRREQVALDPLRDERDDHRACRAGPGRGRLRGRRSGPGLRHAVPRPDLPHLRAAPPRGGVPGHRRQAGHRPEGRRAARRPRLGAVRARQGEHLLPGAARGPSPPMGRCRGRR